MVAFKGGATGATKYPTPEALYPDLPRKSGAVPGLLVHQGDLLRRYAADSHVATADLALELPTGTGKTIPALVIAEWRRRTRKERVVYACPTEQLTKQVAAAADREGIPAVTLTGSHTAWDPSDDARYVSGKAVAITTYTTVFNSSPKLAPPQLLIFDDAHNGEQYVANQYSVTVDRWGGDSPNPDLYVKLLEILTPALDGIVAQRLLRPEAESGHHNAVQFIVPARHDQMPERLSRTLSQTGSPWCFRYAMIRDVLASCLVYVTHSSIQIRPLIPPTRENTLFSEASQRLYLSATLGAAGELERAFGRTGIKRLGLPETAPEPRSGRRFFVFPGLLNGGDSNELTKEIVKLAGKALVLAPDRTTAVRTAGSVRQPAWPLLTIDDVAHGMGPFVAQQNAVCALASRYDGLDLPDHGCRLEVIENVPDRDHLQERFLSSRVRAGAALSERVRTRVVQGVGRCTRGSSDWAVVVVLGDLTKYLLRQENLTALSAELQAEINFGVENSTNTTQAEILENVSAFLSQETDDTWRESGEPIVAQLRAEAVRKLPDGSEILFSAVPAEIQACALAGQGRWQDASAKAQQVTQALSFGGATTKGYRGFWLYLAGIWAYRAASNGAPAASGSLANARALIRQAEQTAEGTWARYMPLLPAMEAPALPAHDDQAVATAMNLLQKIAPGQLDNRLGSMIEGLKETAASAYEPALTQLGIFLGAEANKPSGTGRCDSTWCWGNHLWAVVEAKSDQEPDGVMAHKDIRQVNDQLRILKSDRKHQVIPDGSFTALISPKPAVDPTGAIGAEDHAYLVHPETIWEIGQDVQHAWEELLAGRTGRDAAGLTPFIATTFQRYGLLPSQIRERLTEYPVGAAGAVTS
ncbi:DEAD/DEAH box helicase family protein [Streptomyces yangpuensis]|uniref:DEAD/DEAH box helicase family protein n=1 Tax=Streptomyces yangpuensis TaxID=1648182 RepID=A0ABY5Q134_9ACTN|nr:DEAD/DEAH box helicase [Streptomyces yangpuensis]UUY50142.1 DEAD/DEAH box helicase family protein [Streptomyces yangpuensis]